MKTPEEIKKLLANHKGCIYDGDALMADALAYIQQLEQINADFAERMARLEAKLAKYRGRQEPLTLIEVLQIPGCEENYPLYWLNRNGTGHWALTFALGKNVDLTEPGTIEKIMAVYGTDYVLFRKKPTDAEKAAIEWNEALEEG